MLHRVPVVHRRQVRRDLYRGLADNSVGEVIEALLHKDLVRVDEARICPPRQPRAALVRNASATGPNPRTPL